MSRSKTKGFTLIELIIVIVILTIVSYFVLPRFLDIKSRATAQVIRQTEGAIRSTSAIFHAEALVKGVDSGSLNVDGYSFQIESGYIEGFWNGSWRYVLDLGKVISFTDDEDECTKNALCGVGLQRSAPGLPFSTGGINRLILIWPNGYFLNQLCYAYYFNPENGTEPTIGSVSSGC